MSLFQDEGIFVEEIPSFIMFTPEKLDNTDIKGNGITPGLSKDLSALLIDEDSGLGMEDHEICKFRGQVKNTTDTPTTLHTTTKCKRRLSDEGNTFSEFKRRKQLEAKEKNNDRATFRKTLSFGDETNSTSAVESVVERLVDESELISDGYKINRTCVVESVVDRFFDESELVSDGSKVNRTSVVESVVDRLVDESQLISDGSRFYTLPTVNGKHKDLKNITPETMVDVLKGKYDHVISDYRIIDCRYPYEYNGGHIKGAENLYTQEKVLEVLHSDIHKDKKSPIIIFHCEFSSERGPKLCRYLRAKDREMNSDNYPALNYPEVYLLCGGYKEFYESGYKQWCEPMNYKPMLHSQHSEDLRHFRSKSKSWTAGQKQVKRSKRLDF